MISKMRTKLRANLIRKLRSSGKRNISILLILAFLFTNIFSVFTLPFLFPAQPAYAAAGVPLSLKLDNFDDISLLQLNGTSAIKLYNGVNMLRLNEATVGPKASTFTAGRISLASDRSFSTYFKFRISEANNYNNGGGDGFTFTVQTAGSTARGTLNAAMASDGIIPAVNIEFDTYEDGFHTDHIGINTNGNPASLATVNASNIADGNEHHVWVDYNGAANQLEVRMSDTENRPATATLTKTGLELSSVLDSSEVYVGFTAACGSAYEAHDILKWYFNNDYSPIDLINNTYVDASRLTLTANPAVDTNSSTITAEVTDMAGTPVPNIPVTFTTDLGTLSQSMVSTDALGQAVVTLDAGLDNGTASVKAVAQGGAYGTVTVGLVGDPDQIDVAADKAALDITFGGTDTATSVTQALGELPTSGANGTTITWASDNTAVVSDNGQTVNRPSYSTGDVTVTLTATIAKGSASDTKNFSLTVKALPMNDAEAVAEDKAAVTIGFNGTDTASGVTRDIVLPTAGARGSAIYWSSSHPLIINSAGRVVQPPRSDVNKQVALTAYIRKGMAMEKRGFTVTVMADQSAPQIVSTVPASNATNIARGEPIKVKFSEPIVGSNNWWGIKLNMIKVTTGFLGWTTEEKVPVKANLSISGDTLVITPLAPLNSYTKYEIIIPSDCVQDRAKNSFTAPGTYYGWKLRYIRVFVFQTGQHTEPPVIVSHYPANNGAGIVLNPEISITFDEPMKAGPVPGGLALKDAAGRVIPANTEISGKNVILTPKAFLTGNTNYRVELPIGSVRTTSNKDLAEPYTFGFTTGVFEVVSQPEAGETNVGINTPIIVKYTGNMQTGPNLGAVTVKGEDNNPVNVTTMVNNGVLLINPVNNLEFATRYTVKVPAGALTAADGGSNGEYVFGFTTIEEIKDSLPQFNCSPVAQIEGDPVSFDASEVFNQVGKDFERTITDYSWDFGDGSSGGGTKVSHSYADPGTYDVVLRLADNKGQVHTVTNNVLIKSLADITLDVTPEGSQKYFHQEKTIGDFLNEAGFGTQFSFGAIGGPSYNNTSDSTLGPEFTVTLNTDGVPLSNRKVAIYKGSTKIKEVTTFWNGQVTFRLDQHLLNWGDNVLSFEAYGQVVQRVIHYVEANSSTYKISIWGYNSVDGLRVFIDGEEKPGVQVGGEYVIHNIKTGPHTLKLTAPYFYAYEDIVESYKKEYCYMAMMEPDIPSDIPVIRWVASGYSDSRRDQKDIIKGTYLPTTLKAVVDWKGHKPGYVRFVTPDKIYKEADGALDINLGRDLRPGSRISATAVSGFGIESAAVDAGIRIISRPPVGGVAFNTDTGEYVFSNVGGIPEALSPGAPDSLPFFAGNSLGIDHDNFQLSGGMDNDGNLVFTIAAGGGKEKTRKRTLRAPKKDYKVDVGGVSIEGFLGAELTYAYRENIDQWAFKGGTITVQVNGSATKKQYFLIPVVFVPGYVRGTIGVNTETGLEITKDLAKGTTDYQGIIMIGPNAEIALGAGGDDLYIEGYLNGEVDFQYSFPVNEVSVAAELNGGVRAQAWVFSWENNMLHYEWTYPEEEASAAGISSMAALVPKPVEFKPSSRDYLNNGTVRLEPGVNLRALGAESENISSTLLQSSIFPVPDPVIVNNGSDTVLAWVADNPARSDMNRTELRFARHDGTNWSAPQFMNLDDTGDFSPRLAGTADGIIAVWENVYRPLPESAVLADMSAGMEIAAAQSADGLMAWGDFTNLTDNNYLDHSPQLAASGDSAILLWTANRSNDLTGSAASPNEIMFARWNGTSWTEPAAVISDLGALTYTTVAYNGNEGVFAYTVDGDDNTATANDQELYVITYDGSQWSSPIQITDNDVQDANPQSAYINNQLYMVWYQDGQIVYTRGIQNNPAAVAGITGASADFAVTSDNDRMALVFNQPAARGQNIYTALYDSAFDTWSYPILLTEGEGYLYTSMGPAIGQAGNLMITHSKAELITSEAAGIQYTNPGQVDLGMITFTPRHDLSVSAEGIRFSQDNPLPGSSVSITADISNDGDFAEPNVEVSFYNGDPAAGGTEIGSTQMIQEVIPARGKASVTVDWTVPTGSGPYSVYVVVDPEEKTGDGTRENNIAFTDAAAPDIEISDLQYTSLGGTKYLIAADITNIGSVDAGSTQIALYEGENEDTLAATKEVAALQSGERTQASFVWDAAGKEFINGQFRLSTRLSSPAGVSEYTEENNVYQLALAQEPLYAKSFLPAQNSLTAPINQAITITFNTEIQAGPTFNELALLDEAGNEVAVTKAVEGSTLTIAPAVPLAYETTYTLMVKTGDVTGLNGSSPESDFVLNFTTDREHVNPAVSFTYPAAEMADTPLDADINIMFNENVAQGADFNSIRLTDTYGWNVAVQSQLNGGTLVLYPTANLRYGREYTVTVPAEAVLSNTGKPLEADYSFTFTTLPDPNPSSHSGSSASPVQSQVITTDLVTEDGLKVVIVSTGLPDRADSVRQAAAALGAEMLVNPVELKIEAVQANGKRKSLSNFNQYVERKITLPGHPDPARAAGVLFNPYTGQLIPVPTVFETIDGKTTAAIKHQGSGIYTVISVDKTFADIQNHWAKNDIEILASKLVISGKGKNLYEPQSKVTRAEFATLLVRALGLTEIGTNRQRFADVSSQWFAGAVNSAAAAGLISGYNDGTFRPNANITREEMASMVTRALALAGYDFEIDQPDDLLNRFGDSREIRDWSKTAVAKAVKAGIVNGNEQAEFLPGAKASRAEAAVMVLRTLRYVGFINEV